MPITEVHSQADFNTLINSESAVVKFSATWCGPCRTIQPYYEKEASKHNDIKFAHVDIDKARSNLPNEIQGIRGVPTFKFYRNGTQVNQLIGANPSQLSSLIEKIKPPPKKNEPSGDDDDYFDYVTDDWASPDDAEIDPESNPHTKIDSEGNPVTESN